MSGLLVAGAMEPIPMVPSESKLRTMRSPEAVLPDQEHEHRDGPENPFVRICAAAESQTTLAPKSNDTMLVPPFRRS